MRIYWSFLLIGALVLPACSGAGPRTAGAASAPAVQVRTAVAAVQSLPAELQVTGRIEAMTSVTVKAQASGIVIRAHFREGDVVKQGDVLFDIDPAPYQEAIHVIEANLIKDKATMAQLEASVIRAEALEAHAALQRTRYENLRKEGVASAQQADEAAVEGRSRQQSVRVERAAVESARAAAGATTALLQQARLLLSYCTVRAPISGRTGSLALRPGNVAKANESDLVTIHGTAPVYVSFPAPEERLPVLRRRLESGSLTVNATFPGDDKAAAIGQVRFLENAVDSRTGTIRARAELANGDGRFWHGQYVEVRVLLEERPNAIVLPSSALQTGQRGNFVYVVRPDDTVEQRPVVAGPRAMRTVSIDKGVQAGERVVTEGHMRIAPGMKVRAAS